MTASASKLQNLMVETGDTLRFTLSEHNKVDVLETLNGLVFQKFIGLVHETGKNSVLVMILWASALDYLQLLDGVEDITVAKYGRPLVDPSALYAPSFRLRFRPGSGVAGVLALIELIEMEELTPLSALTLSKLHDVSITGNWDEAARDITVYNRMASRSHSDYLHYFQEEVMPHLEVLRDLPL